MVKRIILKELQDLNKSGKRFTLVDVLSKENFEKEHIKGAISLPVEEIGSRATQVLNKNDMVVVYCGGFNCTASTQAAEKLQKLGFTNVLDYKGGIEDYKAANGEFEGSMHSCRTPSCCSC